MPIIVGILVTVISAIVIYRTISRIYLRRHGPTDFRGAYGELMVSVLVAVILGIIAAILYAIKY